MPKKIIRRKSSSSRRVTARPLSFWQFIRKNFLIISGLLLLPVTVGAVVSSYNYANQGSAAGRRNVLRTQIVNPIACPTPRNPGGPCRSLAESGQCIPVGSCVQSSDIGWCRCLGYQISGDNDYQCGLGSGCQALEGVPTVASPVCISKRYEPVSCSACLVTCVMSNGREITEGTVDSNNTECYSKISLSTCGNPSPAPTAVSSASSSGGNCNNPGGNNGEWRPCEGNLGQGSNTGTTSYNCVNGRWVPHEFDSNCTHSSNTGEQPTNPPPTSVPVNTNLCGTGSHSFCEGKEAGYEYRIKPDYPVFCRCTKLNDGSCSCATVTEKSTGFDVKKAIKNFFGIFGF